MRRLCLLAGLTACTPHSGEVGAPCDDADDCDLDLVCDLHDGAGTCQAGHSHDDVYENGLVKLGDSVAVFFTSEPPPMANTDLNWTFDIDNLDGTPVNMAGIVVRIRNLDTGGAALGQPPPIETSPGVYRSEGNRFDAPGRWRIDLTINRAPVFEIVDYTFEVP